MATNFSGHVTLFISSIVVVSVLCCYCFNLLFYLVLLTIDYSLSKDSRFVLIAYHVSVGG
jgi:hypothetical protein